MDAENARLLDRLTKQQEQNQSLRVENAKLKAKFEDIEQATEYTAYLPLEIERLNAEVQSLKAENRKTILEAKFSTWREEQVKYNPDYNMEEEAQWLIDEATIIQDAIDIFNELYNDGMDDCAWKLKCDQERKWEVDCWWMDDEGEYTLTEAEFEAQNE